MAVSNAALGVESDPTLLADIRRFGKFDTTGCCQCGSCTIACELVTDSVSFPRRLIRYALLGLRKPLVESLEPWICHDCGDCSLVCPRQAEPRISMLTLRRFLSAQYDWTGLGSKILASRAWYIGSLVSVGALTFLLILLSEVGSVEGQAGNFTVTLKRRPRFVDAAKCTGCGTCVSNCPVRPRRVLILDALDVGRDPGELFEIAPKDIPAIKCDDFSLHQLPTSNLLRELEEQCEVEVRVLGGQTAPLPEEVRPGLSEPVRCAVPLAAERIAGEYFHERPVAPTTGAGVGSREWSRE